MQDTTDRQDNQDRSTAGLLNRGIGFVALALLAGFAIWFLVTRVEFGGDSPLPLGDGFKGRALIVSIEKMGRVKEVRHLGTDGKHYLVTPSSDANDLVVLQINVHNDEASVILLNFLEPRAVELRVKDSRERFNLLDVTPENVENVREVPESHPAEDRYSPFLTSAIQLPQGHSLLGGWVVFDVPKELEVKQIRWQAGGDVLFIPRT